MFVGEYRHTLDAKNRIFVPAKLREDIPGEIFVVRDYREKCLKVYSPDEWERRIEPIKQQSARLAEATLRSLNRNAALLAPDSQGRVVLTQALIDHAGIKKDVVVVGCDTYAEIWAAEVYDEFVAHEDMDALREELEKYGL